MTGGVSSDHEQGTATTMSKAQPRRSASEEPPSEEYGRFEQMVRALFRVDGKDVEKHEPNKRPARDARR